MAHLEDHFSYIFKHLRDFQDISFSNRYDLCVCARTCKHTACKCMYL